MILGDFNSGCSYVRTSSWPKIRLATDRRFYWLIPNDADTTVGRSDCAYDRYVQSDSIREVKLYLSFLLNLIKDAKNYWILHAAFVRGNRLDNQRSWPKYPDRTADMSPRHLHWFRHEMTDGWGSERLQKFHTVDESLTSLGSASDWSWREGKFASYNQRLYPYLDRSGSAVVSPTSFRVETSALASRNVGCFLSICRLWLKHLIKTRSENQPHRLV